MFHQAIKLITALLSVYITYWNGNLNPYKGRYWIVPSLSWVETLTNKRRSRNPPLELLYATFTSILHIKYFYFSWMLPAAMQDATRPIGSSSAFSVLPKHSFDMRDSNYRCLCHPIAHSALSCYFSSHGSTYVRSICLRMLAGSSAWDTDSH